MAKRKMRYRVRYHLANGEHKNHWQIKDFLEDKIHYYFPKSSIILLDKCQIWNLRPVAQVIFEGSNKQVCGWINALNVTVLGGVPRLPAGCLHLRFNPKVLPYWHVPPSTESVDGSFYDRLYLTPTGVYFDPQFRILQEE